MCAVELITDHMFDVLFSILADNPDISMEQMQEALADVVETAPEIYAEAQP